MTPKIPPLGLLREEVIVAPSGLSRLRWGSPLKEQMASGPSAAAPNALNGLALRVDGERSGTTTKPKRLVLSIPASHALRATGNLVTYLPNFMASSASTYYKPHPAPFLREHYTGGDGFFAASPPADPIGRVRMAVYEDYAHLPRLGGRRPSMMRYEEVYALYRELLKEGLIHDPSFAGVGHLRLTAEVTDPDAIEKFLDERYMTVSISLLPEKAFNGWTGKVWGPMSCSEEDGDGEDEPHPREMRDGVRGTLLAGPGQYKELSTASMPGDVYAFPDKVMALTEAIKLDSFSERERLGAPIAPKSLLLEGWSLEDVQFPETQSPRPQVGHGQPPNRKAIPGGSLMKSHLETLNEHIQKNSPKSISQEEYDALSPADFCGPEQTYPAQNETQLKASLLALESDASLDAAAKGTVKRLLEGRAKKLGLDLKPKKPSEGFKALSDYDLLLNLSEGLSILSGRGMSLEDIPALQAILSERQGNGAKEAKELAEKTIAVKTLDESLAAEQAKSKALQRSALVQALVIAESVSFESEAALIDKVGKMSPEEISLKLSETLASEGYKKALVALFEGRAKEADKLPIQAPVAQSPSLPLEQTNAGIYERAKALLTNESEAASEAYLERMIQFQMINQDEANKVREQLKKL